MLSGYTYVVLELRQRATRIGRTVALRLRGGLFGPLAVRLDELRAGLGGKARSLHEVGQTLGVNLILGHFKPLLLWTSLLNL